MSAALILGADAGREDLNKRSILPDTIADGAGAVAIVGQSSASHSARSGSTPRPPGWCPSLIALPAIRLWLVVGEALSMGTAYVPDTD